MSHLPGSTGNEKVVNRMFIPAIPCLQLLEWVEQLKLHNVIFPDLHISIKALATYITHFTKQRSFSKR